MTPLSQPVPVATIASVTVQSASLDQNGNVVLVWLMYGAQGNLLGRQSSVLPATSFAQALAGPASSFATACEAALAPLLVSSGSVTALPPGVTPPAPSPAPTLASVGTAQRAAAASSSSTSSSAAAAASAAKPS